MMSELNIPIKIVSDVVCPWCIIGYKKLVKALQIYRQEYPEHQLKTEIEWLPFELNPNMPQGGENLRAHLAAKYGTTLEGSIAARKKITKMGAELGFTFKYFDEMRMYNTRKAHILIHKAPEFGLQQPLKMAMFSAFFSERKVMDDNETLVKVAESVGLDRAMAEQALTDEAFSHEIVKSQNVARQQGVTAVPAFIFNNKYMVTGAQEPETFVQLISRVRSDFSQSTVITD